jgi:hypothetical protein
MKTPLVPINIMSCYTNKLGDLLPLPTRMAKCTPDTYNAIFKIAADLAKKGGKLILSDLFRSYEMQLQAHNDFVSKKKKAFSPAPVGSLHEAGRAFDLDLGAIKISLADFWVIAAKYGVIPIIKEPKSNASEAWHFDCRGSHQIVYQYYAAGKGSNFTAYKAAAISGVLALGLHVDDFDGNQVQAAIQSCVIRLGKEIGSIDGLIGRKTQKAIEELGIAFNLNNAADMLLQLENMIQQKFPAEFTMPTV